MLRGWDIERITIYFKGHLAELADTYLGNLISSGFFQFWEMAYLSTVNRRIRKEVEEKRMQDEQGLETASMKTSLKSFFKLFIVLLAFDVFSFIIELVSARLRIIALLSNALTRFNISNWCSKSHVLTNFKL